MALYDNKFDWYDIWLPGSTTTALVHNASSVGKSLQTLNNDIGDMIGLGSQRRQQEFNAAEAEKEREFNAAEAEKQRQYETQMSNSAYQRAIADLKDAGLNPYLVYGSGGTPASTPTASSASAGSGARSGIQSNINLISQVSGLMNSVTNARALDHQIKRSSSHPTTQKIYSDLGKMMNILVKTLG